jgi:hypothetical protein
MKLLIKNLMTNNSKEYEINKMYDFDTLIADYGRHITALIKDYESVRPALDKVAKCLSNHHLQATILDPEDLEEVYNPNVELTDNGSTKPKNAADLKDMFEDNEPIEIVDIPEFHVLNSAAKWTN